VILLDTHVLLWYLLDSPQLPSVVRTRIKDEPIVFVSVASIWEIGIKVKLGRMKVAGIAVDSKQKIEAILEACEDEEFEFLSVGVQTSLEAPFLNGTHTDPFDRMLAAQSLFPQKLTIISADSAFDTMNPDIRRYWPGTPLFPTQTKKATARSTKSSKN
jgi:PIN domain nuclease of toxin-antitoxin system